MSGRAGIDRVVADALDQGEAIEPARPAEQLALLPEGAPVQAAGGAAKGESGEPVQSGGVGRGRPPGARNRRTDEMVRYLNRFGAGPLVGLARIVNAIGFDEKGLPDFRELAKALGMQRKEAAAFWAKCAGELAPYMHQKLPTAIDITGDSAGSLWLLNMGAVQGDPAIDPGELAGMLGDVIDVDPEDGESEENQ